MKKTIVLLIVSSFLFQSCDEIKRQVNNILGNKSSDQESSAQEDQEYMNQSSAKLNNYHSGSETSYRIDGPANFRTKASSKGDVVFSIYDNVGLDFIKDRRNNWYECGFYLSDKTNINWLERYSKRTGNQIGEVYSGSNLYNSHKELIGKSKAKIYVSRDQLSNKIVLYAYTARQNLR